MMLGEKGFYFWFYWRVMWYVVTPLVILTLGIWCWIENADIFSTMLSTYWGGFEGVGYAWSFISIGLVPFPFYMIYEYIKTRKQQKPWYNMFKPNEEWGPYLKRYHVDRYAQMGR